MVSNSNDARRFLGEVDFEGERIPATGPVTNGGQATYIGLMTFTNVASNMVASLLPQGFELAARKTSWAPDLHPVVLLFGDQTDGIILSSGGSIPTGTHYSEVIFAVPFVVRQGRQGSQPRWHTHVIRMYLDNDAAVAAGAFYGYRKRKAWLEWKGDDIRIRSPLGDDFLVGEDLLEGSFQWGPQWHDGNPALDEIPNFLDMVSIMTTRILGQTGGAMICSHFEWNLDHAKVAQAEGFYSMKAPFRDDMDAWPGLSPFRNAIDGAVLVRGVRWRLSNQVEQCS